MRSRVEISDSHVSIPGGGTSDLEASYRSVLSVNDDDMAWRAPEGFTETGGAWRVQRDGGG